MPNDVIAKLILSKEAIAMDDSNPNPVRKIEHVNPCRKCHFSPK